MGVLTEIPNMIIRMGKGKFRVNPAFDVVLEVQRLYKENELSNLEKLNQALHMFVVNDWNLRLLTMTEKTELMEQIYEKYIQVKKRPAPPQRMAVLDFQEDGDFIYASFMQEYGIDLIDQQGKLPWKKFLYLFNGLSDDTKIKQIMRIRDMELPQFNGKNSKQIQDIQQLKQYYALPVHGGGGQHGLDMLFAALEGMAKK